MYEQQQRTLIL